MKAISLWQPWATAIALGAKRVETRHWSTKYRGPLLIHAAKRCNKDELIHVKSTWNWCDVLAPLGVEMGGNEWLWNVLPFGKLVAVCNLVDCRASESFTQGELDALRKHAGREDARYGWTERMMGNFGPSRFGWILEDIQPLRAEVPFKGAQGFFNVPDSVVSQQLQEWPGRVKHAPEAFSLA